MIDASGNPLAYRVSPAPPRGGGPTVPRYDEAIIDFMSLYPGLPASIAEELATMYLVTGEIPADIAASLQSGNYDAAASLLGLTAEDVAEPQTETGRAVQAHLDGGGDINTFGQVSGAGVSTPAAPAPNEGALTAPLGPVDVSSLPAPPGFVDDPTFGPVPTAPDSPTVAPSAISVARDDLDNVRAAVDELSNMVDSPLAETARDLSPAPLTGAEPLSAERGLPGISLSTDVQQSIDALNSIGVQGNFARDAYGFDGPLPASQRADAEYAAMAGINRGLNYDPLAVAQLSAMAIDAAMPDRAAQPASLGLGAYSRSSQDVAAPAPASRGFGAYDRATQDVAPTPATGFLGLDDNLSPIMGVAEEDAPTVLGALDQLSLSNLEPAATPASVGFGAYDRASQDVAATPSLADAMADVSFGARSPAERAALDAQALAAVDLDRAIASFGPPDRTGMFSPNVALGVPDNRTSFADIDYARAVEANPFSAAQAMPGTVIGRDDYGALATGRAGYDANLSGQQRADNLAADLGYATPEARGYLSANAALMGVAPQSMTAAAVAPETMGFDTLSGMDFGMPSSMAGIGLSSANPSMGTAANAMGIEGIAAGVLGQVSASPIGFSPQAADPFSSSQASILGGIPTQNEAVIDNWSNVPDFGFNNMAIGPRGLGVAIAPNVSPIDPYTNSAIPSTVQSNLNRDVINPVDMNLEPMTSWSDDPSIGAFGRDAANMAMGNLGFDVSTGPFGRGYDGLVGTTMGEAVTPGVGMIGVNTDPMGIAGLQGFSAGQPATGGFISGMNATDALSASPVGMAAQSLGAAQASFGQPAPDLSDDGLASAVNGLNSGISTGVADVGAAGLGAALDGRSAGIDAGIGNIGGTGLGTGQSASAEGFGNLGMGTGLGEQTGVAGTSMSSGVDTGTASSSSSGVGAAGATSGVSGADAGLGGQGLGSADSSSPGSAADSDADSGSIGAQDSGVDTGTSADAAAADAAADAASAGTAGADAGAAAGAGPGGGDTSGPGDSGTSGESDGCFLTTACIRAHGLPDDCDELQTLRWYRDNILIEHDAGPRMIADYYATAPGVVAAINARPDAQKIWRGAYGDVAMAVTQIKANRFGEALETYIGLVERMKGLAHGNA